MPVRGVPAEQGEQRGGQGDPRVRGDETMVQHSDEKTAWIYVSRDTVRSLDEGQYYAEVVSQPGEEDEDLLYTTNWYTDVHAAWNEAEKWMKDNGVVDAPD
jgi:hypothetical protein